METYSRDVLTVPLEYLATLLDSIRDGSFNPDALVPIGSTIGRYLAPPPPQEAQSSSSSAGEVPIIDADTNTQAFVMNVVTGLVHKANEQGEPACGKRMDPALLVVSGSCDGDRKCMRRGCFWHAK